MNAADPFTRASATWVHAWQSGAKTGPAFEVYAPRSKRPTWLGHAFAVVAGCALAVLLLAAQGKLL